MSYALTCSGPGPHEPADGILGSSSVEGATGLCASDACTAAPPVDPGALIAAARVDVNSATTIAQLRARTLELDRLRALYPTVT